MGERYPSVRQFFPQLLQQIEFQGNQAGKPVLKGLTFLKGIERQKHPSMKGAPLDFVSPGWKRHVAPYHQTAATTRCAPFLAASRAGDFNALLAVLDSEVVFRIDGAASPKGVSREIRGAQAAARRFSGGTQGARPALVNGAVALIVAPRGHLFLVLKLTIRNGKIAEIEAVADPTRLRQFDLAVLDD